MHLVIPLRDHEGDFCVIVPDYDGNLIQNALDEMKQLSTQLRPDQCVAWGLPALVVHMEILPVPEVPYLDKALESGESMMLNDEQWQEVTAVLDEEYLWDGTLRLECTGTGKTRTQLVIHPEHSGFYHVTDIQLP
ncbi:hypothetical protein HRbin16_01697 [bacterium HR16]|nr:hypothetical protein HRbin16_01697 [bacterium HR16]